MIDVGFDLTRGELSRLAELGRADSMFHSEYDAKLAELGFVETHSGGIIRAVHVSLTETGRAAVESILETARAALYDHGLLTLKYEARFRHDYSAEAAREEVAAILTHDADEFERPHWRNPTGEYWFECSVCEHEVPFDHNCVEGPDAAKRLADILRAAER